MLGRWAEPCGDQQSAELIALQRGGMGLIVHPGTADVGGRGMIQEFLFDRVPEEPGAGGQPASDSRAGAVPGLKFPGEALDVGAADCEQGKDRTRHQVVNWRRFSA